MRRDRTAVLHFAAQVVRSMAGFGTTLLAARYFGAAGLGIYSQVLALLFWLKFPSNSLTTAISKRMSESEELTGHFTAGVLATLSYGVVVATGVFLFEELVNGYLDADAAHLVVTLLVVNSVFDIVKSGFIGQKRVAVAGWLGTAEQILRFAAQLTFVLGGAMVIGLVLGHVVSLFVFAVFGVVLLRNQLTVPDRDDFDELRTFAQYSWLGNLQGLALTWMDILVLGLFVANDLLGIYQASWTLASFLGLTSKSISKTLFPEVSDLGTSGEFTRAKELISDGLMFSGVFLIPGAFGASVVGDRVLAIYSSEFAAGATVLVVLIGARTLYAFGSQFLSALNGLDHPDLAFRVNVVFFSVNAVGNVGLVYLFGWYGAAVATLLSTAAYLGVGWYELRTEVGPIELPAAEIGYQTVASLVMVGVLWPLLPVVPQTIPGTLVLVLAGAGTYGVSLLALSSRIRAKVHRLTAI